VRLRPRCHGWRWGGTEHRPLRELVSNTPGWLHGGVTSLDNLVMLCTFHHHLVHEGGWTVTAGADSVFVFHSPAGTLLAPEPPREVVNDTTGWLRVWADERKLNLGPEVNLPQWDGKTPDYNAAVG
jgi:hypothetical protein